eukprot:scaffold34636_cov171-Amphora_coffeaeformis.AAC.6
MNPTRLGRSPLLRQSSANRKAKSWWLNDDDSSSTLSSDSSSPNDNGQSRQPPLQQQFKPVATPFRQAWFTQDHDDDDDDSVIPEKEIVTATAIPGSVLPGQKKCTDDDYSSSPDQSQRVQTSTGLQAFRFHQAWCNDDDDDTNDEDVLQPEMVTTSSIAVEATKTWLDDSSSDDEDDSGKGGIVLSLVTTPASTTTASTTTTTTTTTTTINNSNSQQLPVLASVAETTGYYHHTSQSWLDDSSSSSDDESEHDTKQQIALVQDAADKEENQTKHKAKEDNVNQQAPPKTKENGKDKKDPCAEVAQVEPIVDSSVSMQAALERPVKPATTKDVDPPPPSETKKEKKHKSKKKHSSGDTKIKPKKQRRSKKLGSATAEERDKLLERLRASFRQSKKHALPLLSPSALSFTPTSSITTEDDNHHPSGWVEKRTKTKKDDAKPKKEKEKAKDKTKKPKKDKKSTKSTKDTSTSVMMIDPFAALPSKGMRNSMVCKDTGPTSGKPLLLLPVPGDLSDHDEDEEELLDDFVAPNHDFLLNEIVMNPFAAIPNKGMRNSIVAKKPVPTGGLLGRGSDDSSDDDDGLLVVAKQPTPTTFVKKWSNISLGRKRVEFASEAKVAIHDVESYLGLDLWYKRCDLKQMMQEAEAMGKMFAATRKEYGMALSALYGSFQKTLSASDEAMILKFLSKCSKARGLEDCVIDHGRALRRQHRHQVIQAQEEAKEKGGQDNGSLWDNIHAVSHEASKAGVYMAHRMAQFDASEANRQ